MRLLKHPFKLFFICLFGLFLGWRFWWTALDHNPEQDNCTFGTVSNARYRELLAEAKILASERGPFLLGEAVG